LFPDQEKANPDVEVLRKSIERFARRRGINAIVDCAPSRDSRTRAFRLGGELIAKAFSTNDSERYERERASLQASNAQGRIPQLVASSFDPECGGYLVMTAVKGRVAADVYRTLSGKEYAGFARALGACMAAVHALLRDGALYPVANNLVAERESHFDAFHSAADRLKSAGLLQQDAIPALAEAVAAGRDRAFASSRGLIHGDLHVWNILLDERNGQPWCSLIDFEESAFSHVELDFARPLVSVLGQAFPGGRLAGSWQAIWQGFVEGYASLSNEPPKLEVAISHAVAWCVWGAALGLDCGQPPRCRELVESALGAAAVSGDRNLARLASRAGK